MSAWCKMPMVSDLLRNVPEQMDRNVLIDTKQMALEKRAGMDERGSTNL